MLALKGRLIFCNLFKLFNTRFSGSVKVGVSVSTDDVMSEIKLLEAFSDVEIISSYSGGKSSLDVDPARERLNINVCIWKDGSKSSYTSTAWFCLDMVVCLLVLSMSVDEPSFFMLLVGI